MKNINRILVLLLILILTMAILVGCGDSKKAPEGVSQDFYDDMVGILKEMEKAKRDDIIDIDDGKIDIYKEERVFLTLKEEDILDNVSDLQFWAWLYDDDGDDKIQDKLRVARSVENISRLMEVDINLKKILNKR